VKLDCDLRNPILAEPPSNEKAVPMFCPICGEEARRVGHNRNGSQRYRCDACARYLTDESTRPQDHRCIDPAKMLTILNQILEGSSIRSQERVYRVHRDTIISNMIEAGEKCRAFTEKVVQNVECTDVQCDELWGFVAMKEKTRLRLNRAEEFGDVWCFTAIERHTKLILTWHVGKRTPIDTGIFADNLYFATRGRFQLTTDGFTPYRTAIPAILGGRVDFATLVKVYGESEDDRRYSCGTVIDVIATARLGNPDEARICTSHVERSNKTLRMQIRRLTRLTDAHSKKLANHEAAMALFFAYYNFCRRHMTIKMTPAQKAGLTTETWTLERLLAEAARV
jgi:transposase-like protein/IS1 family transposase